MKRIIACLLAVCMMLLLTACGSDESGDSGVDLEALAGELTESAAFTMEMSQYQVNAAVASGTYGYDDSEVKSCMMYYNGAAGEEIYLAQAADGDAADHLAALCKTRVENQELSLQNYVPEAIPRLENAVIETSGEYVVFVVADDSAAARAIVDRYFP